jgi:hypothetical protein
MKVKCHTHALLVLTAVTKAEFIEENVNSRKVIAPENLRLNPPCEKLTKEPIVKLD